jgi:preprotein translocase subunit SecA
MYPERSDPQEHWFDVFERAVTAAPRFVAQRLRRLSLRHRLARINALEVQVRALSDNALQVRCRRLHDALRRDGLKPSLVATAFAIIREVSRRVVGMRHHDVQILGGLAMLDGAIAEMDTGEGKTLTAALTAATAAMANLPVHVVTVNDYLAARDAENLGPIYRYFGLSVGVVTNALHPSERAAIYAKDVVYVSNKEIAFDYLRDRLVLGNRPQILRRKLQRLVVGDGEAGQIVMRGLHFAIVDEADSVLIDEARTPLIISRETKVEEERRWTQEAFAMVDGLQPDIHYRLRREERRLELTAAGRDQLADRAEAVGGIWTNRIRREEGARQALSALLLFARGEHYLVADGKVQIVDEYTGRTMADRSWSDGLHQLIEAKEGCEITTRKSPIARMTYQRFFRRYLHLAGMTGTAREVSGELSTVYRLVVSKIPPNAPSRRTALPATICRTEDEKWRKIAQRAAELSALGRPVLIGTRSVLASQTMSRWLEAAGLPHAVLNAERSADEAAIIAMAGRAGRITVATNMAGRGVDIAVDPRALELGGLHVVLSERHDAGRIDRQLEGRTARRGEAGTTEAILSLEDTLLELVPHGPFPLLMRLPGRLGAWSARRIFDVAQRRAERSHARDRRNLLAQDRRLGVLLAFSGANE